MFIRPAGLLSSGFTGLAILIDRIAELYGFSVSTSLALVALNLPVALMCCRSINVKFTVFSPEDVSYISRLVFRGFFIPTIFGIWISAAAFTFRTASPALPPPGTGPPTGYRGSRWT